MTDSLRLSGEHKYIQHRWADIIMPQAEPEQDDRPVEEIAADIWRRAGLNKGGE